jgi:hypothetical protein
MNVRSKDAEPIDPVIKENKEYIPITYGGYGSGGRPGGPTNLSAGLGGGLFDFIFEKLRIKKRPRKRSEGEE